MKQPKCYRCTSFHDVGEPEGECRAHTPQTWTKVHREAWCDEYKQRKRPCTKEEVALELASIRSRIFVGYPLERIVEAQKECIEASVELWELRSKLDKEYEEHLGTGKINADCH